MGQGAALQEEAQRPDGQLVGDEERLVTLGEVERGDDGAAHALDDLPVGLPPGGAQRVDVAGPVGGVGQDPAVAVDGHALEGVAGLDESGIRCRRQAEGGGGGGAGLPGPLQG